MKYRLLSFAFSGIFTLALASCNNASDPATKAGSQPPIEVSAVKLLADYEADEPAAEKVYGGRTLVVSGEVMSIDKQHDDKVEILLNSPESSIGSVRCHFSARAAAALANVNREDNIVVKGVCANMDSHVQVVVEDCELAGTGNASTPATSSVKNEPNNVKALEEVNNEIVPVESFITDAGVLYVSTTDEKEPLDYYTKAIREILEKNKSSIRWIKVVEVNTADPSDTAEPYGKLLAELKW